MQKVVSNTGTGANTNRFGSVDYIKITIFGFALAALWASLHSIIIPLRLLDFVAESEKNTYLGLLTFAGLILAMAVQPIAGAISDRSGFGWGRRRPFILLGTILAMLLLPGIGFCGSYAAIFIIYCLLQISSNMAQGPYQGFIPDLVPGTKRGLASGVKSLLEIGGGVVLLYPIALFMDRYFIGEGSPWLWLALGILAIVLLGAMVATVVTVKERPGALNCPYCPLCIRVLRLMSRQALILSGFWYLASLSLWRLLPCRHSLCISLRMLLVSPVQPRQPPSFP